MNDNAKTVWIGTDGQNRNEYARFRKTFELAGEPRQALLHLFADTSYQLYVNGRFVQFGPLRFDPRHPVYDTRDISSFLRKGNNVIAVQANYCGHKTFVTMKSRAGFVAWGEVETEIGEHVDLATGVGEWKCSSVPAYRYAPKASLFLRAAELYDQRLDEADWNAVDFSDARWPAAEPIASGTAPWGELRARDLPYMSGKPIPVKEVRRVLPIARLEDWHTFEVPLPHVSEIHEADRTSRFIAFASWIYAPEDMTVTAGAYYQDTWLNGVKIEGAFESPDSSLRLNQRWSLRAGWNRYFGCVSAYQDVFQHYLALPKDKGIVVSADRDASSGVAFHRSPVQTIEAFEATLKHKPLPYAPEDALEEADGWIAVSREDRAQSPTRNSSWDRYGEPFESLTPDGLEGRTFRLADYPDGFSLLLDIGMTWLVVPRIVLEGAGSAEVDMTFSEHLLEDGVHLKHTHWYGLGDRAIAHDGRPTLDWRLTQPRGFRYMKLTVRGAKSDVTLVKLELSSASYPVERIGSFSSSDPMLDEIWRMGALTQEANMEDAYDDCVTRERGQYIRDAIIQYHNNLVLFGDNLLMRRTLELIGQSADDTGKFRAVYPNEGDYTIADFALNALEGFRAYYAQTGDRALIAEHWDAMRRNLAWFHELADENEGLLLDSEWDVKRGINAHYGGFHGDLAIVDGYMDNTGLHCTFSCTYLIALRCASELAEAIGRTEDREALDRRIRILEESIPRTFWNPDKGCYSDNPARTTHSLHASLFAARANVATPEQLGPIRDHVGRELRSVFANGYDPQDGVYVSPSFSFYIFEGLYLVGLESVAENMMRQGWGWFLAQGLQQTPEYYDLNQSLCHAWSACPTYFLSKYALGVHMPSGGGGEVELRVQAESLTFAEGSVPHPLGKIEVKWHRDNTGNVVYDYVKAPEGVVFVDRN